MVMLTLIPWVTLVLCLVLATYLLRDVLPFMSFSKKKIPIQMTLDVAGLSMWDVYQNFVLPMEKKYRFDQFHSPPMSKGDFSNTPTVLFFGQYSTGKSSLILRLLKQNYPEIRIAPEPSTDNFIFITDGLNNSNTVRGHLAAMIPDGYFHSLSPFGNAFLDCFRVVSLRTSDDSILKTVNIIDTPGILSSSKQRTDRGYDFPGVISWFAKRSTRIYLVFDPYKLDIADDMLNSIKNMYTSENAGKIRFILNKVDMIAENELTSVVSALMFFLSKVLVSSELPRVYTLGEPISADDVGKNKNIREHDYDDLLKDLKDASEVEISSRLDHLVKRATSVQVHALIIDGLYRKYHGKRSWGGWLFSSKIQVQKSLIDDLGSIYQEIHNNAKHAIPMGNFPNLDHMKKKLFAVDFATFQPLDESMFEACKSFMTNEKLSTLRTHIFSNSESRDSNANSRFEF